MSECEFVLMSRSTTTNSSFSSTHLVLDYLTWLEQNGGYLWSFDSRGIIRMI